jgi:hypothetical protein
MYVFSTVLNKTCDSDDACYQPGQPNNLVCFDGMCKCKLDHLEEGGHCKGAKKR